MRSARGRRRRSLTVTTCLRRRVRSPALGRPLPHELAAVAHDLGLETDASVGEREAHAVDDGEAVLDDAVIARQRSALG